MPVLAATVPALIVAQLPLLYVAQPARMPLVLAGGISDEPPLPEIAGQFRERLVDGETVTVGAEGVAWIRRDAGATFLVRGLRAIADFEAELQLEPGAWRVQSLRTEDGRSTRGYLVYSLHERGTGTLLVGELLARASLPASALAGRSVEQASRMITDATRAKFHADHLALKQWVESR